MNEAIRVAIEKHDVKRLQAFAWLVVISPDGKLRDAALAVDLATKACELTDYNDLVAVGTLASVYAEIGDFDAAIKWTEEAIRLTDDSTEPEVRERMLRALANDKVNKPYREHTGTPVNLGGQ